ncbi:MAG: FliH/SctL family protein [Nocardioidaceae bacterium]
MTSTSSDPVVLRDLPADGITAPATATDLRAGHWTRLGSREVLGDPVTESTLAALAEQTRSAARAQGYAAGWGEGRRAFAAHVAAAEAELVARTAAEQDRVRAEHRAATKALVNAIGDAEAEVRRTRDRLAEEAVALALRIAEAVIGRELEVATDPGADALRRALTSLPLDVPVTVRLHPADRAQLDQGVLGDRPVHFVDDPSLGRGDSVVQTDEQVVDATIEAAVARVREVLTR